MKGFLLIFILFVLTIIFNIGSVYGDSWFYPDWPYKEIIYINNSVPTPEDYQVKLIFNSSNIDYSKTNDDGSDLRFTYYHDGSEEEVSYWIETWNETGESIVWIKAPKIDGVYYVYYGNGEGAGRSDIHNTFIFGDDFEDGVISSSLWKAGNPIDQGTWIEDSGVISQTSTTQTLKAMLVNLSESSWITTIKMRPDSWGNDYRGGLAGRETRGEGYEGPHSREFIGYYGHIFTISYNNKSKIRLLKEHYKPFSGAWGPEIDPGFTFSTETWYNIETAFVNSTSMKGRVWEVGKPIPEWQISNNDMNPLINNNTGMYGGYTSTFSFDDLRVRKYSFPEPSYVIGEVETQEQEPPGLIDTDVENLLTGSIHELAESFLGGNYVYSTITAWISNDDSVQFVNSNLSAPSGFLGSDTVPMTRIEEGKYSRTIAARSSKIVEIAVEVLIPYLEGMLLDSLIETQPEIRWDYVIIKDILGGVHPYRVNKRLPSILKDLPTRFLGRATAFVSACPVDMLVIDPEGKRTGSLYENGTFVGIVNEIGKSVYTGRNTEPEFVVIFDPMEGEYRIEIYGNETGVYNFSVISVDNGSVFYGKNYTNIPIGQGGIQTYEEPITDVEPPEAVIGYDTVSEELVVEGKDNFDKNVDVSYEEECSKRLFGFCMEMERNYTLTDNAGNQLILRMRYKKVKHSGRYGSLSFIHARLLSAKYVTEEGSMENAFENNWLTYSINKKSGKIKHFSQSFYMKGRGFVRARYEPGRNKTSVIDALGKKPERIVLEGLHLYEIITDAEELAGIA